MNKKISTENKFLKIYNTQEWLVKVVLVNSFTEQGIVLITENISYIEIFNSLESWVPELILKYTDFNFAVVPFLKQTRFIINNRNGTTITNNTRKFK